MNILYTFFSWQKKSWKAFSVPLVLHEAHTNVACALLCHYIRHGSFNRNRSSLSLWRKSFHKKLPRNASYLHVVCAEKRQSRASQTPFPVPIRIFKVTQSERRRHCREMFIFIVGGLWVGGTLTFTSAAFRRTSATLQRFIGEGEQIFSKRHQRLEAL